MKTILTFFLLSILSFTILAQERKLPETEEEFKAEILKLRQDVDDIQHNLDKTRQRFKLGVGLAALGYTVTIAGGLMLGGDNADTGEVLLYTGGAIGLTGTLLLVDSFKFLRGASGLESYRRRDNQNALTRHFY